MVNEELYVEKERKLTQYFEEVTTEELLKEVQECTLEPVSSRKILGVLKHMKLPQPVVNTLVYYLLVTNNRELVPHKLLILADLCKKCKIHNAKTAITFFKHYYLLSTKENQMILQEA